MIKENGALCQIGDPIQCSNVPANTSNRMAKEFSLQFHYFFFKELVSFNIQIGKDEWI